MQYELRDYQQSLIKSIFTSWAKGNRKIIAQLPTAAGKTVVFSSIALSHAPIVELNLSGIRVTAGKEDLGFFRKKLATCKLLSFHATSGLWISFTKCKRFRNQRVRKKDGFITGLLNMNDVRNSL